MMRLVTFGVQAVLRHELVSLAALLHVLHEGFVVRVTRMRWVVLAMLAMVHLATVLAVLVTFSVGLFALGFLEDVRIARNLHIDAAAVLPAFLFHVVTRSGHLVFLLYALIRGLGLQAVLINAEERCGVGRST